LSPDEVREQRGTFTEPGKESPIATAPWQENLDMFQRLRAGELPTAPILFVLKLIWHLPTLSMRDPVIYRIKTGTALQDSNKMGLYPMYDFAIAYPMLWKESPTPSALLSSKQRPCTMGSVGKLITGLRRGRSNSARLNLSYTVLQQAAAH